MRSYRELFVACSGLLKDSGEEKTSFLLLFPPERWVSEEEEEEEEEEEVCSGCSGCSGCMAEEVSSGKGCCDCTDDSVTLSESAFKTSFFFWYLSRYQSPVYGTSILTIGKKT